MNYSGCSTSNSLATLLQKCTTLPVTRLLDDVVAGFFLLNRYQNIISYIL